MPERDYNILYVLVFMVLVVIICLLFVNMFVGVVVKTYQDQKDKIGFNNILTETERSWLKV